MAVESSDILQQLGLRNKDGSLLTLSATSEPTTERVTQAIEGATAEISRLTGRTFAATQYTEVKRHARISHVYTYLGWPRGIELRPNHIPLGEKQDDDKVEIWNRTEWETIPDDDILWRPEDNSIHVKVAKYYPSHDCRITYTTSDTIPEDAKKCIILSACVDILRMSFNTDRWSYKDAQDAADRMETRYLKMAKSLAVMQSV